AHRMPSVVTDLESTACELDNTATTAPREADYHCIVTANP
ncbi:MAG: hypothetical protein QOF10_4734, partial [Kribbellaceae bacterium]|nr:hypothetical protein [Kribbellaceae bacterium]